MGFHSAGIQMNLLQIRVCQGLGQFLPDAVGTPAVKPLPDGIRLPIPLRQVGPRNAGLQDVQHRIKKQAIVGRSTAGIARFPGQQILHKLPLGIGQFVAATTHDSLLLEIPTVSRKSPFHARLNVPAT